MPWSSSYDFLERTSPFAGCFAGCPGDPLSAGGEEGGEREPGGSNKVGERGEPRGGMNKNVCLLWLQLFF